MMQECSRMDSLVYLKEIGCYNSANRKEIVNDRIESDSNAGN